jgi:DNA-binding transcriptional regulator YiaG
MHNDHMPTSDDIKAARLRLCENQTEFAKRFGVDQATVHRWETKGLPARGAARVAVENLLDSLSPAGPLGAAE